MHFGACSPNPCREIVHQHNEENWTVGRTQWTPTLTMKLLVGPQVVLTLVMAP